MDGVAAGVSASEGSPRFEPLRTLGAGSFGRVVLARDRVRGGQVAVKELLRVNAGALLGFKREFRALAGLSHPNLVTLYELIAEGPRWLLAMEFIAGRPLLADLRGARRRRRGRASRTLPNVASPAGARRVAPAALVRRAAGRRAGPRALRASARIGRGPQALAPGAAARLGAVFLQVARGVQALHAAGVMHRDLKPANIQVETGGRVVLLDFGLAALLDREPGPAAIVGTPRYMSPEQARGAPVTAASDWYSVGVLLHEAIFGVAPIEGAPHEVMARKQYMRPRRRPPPPGVPPPLVELCFALLAPAPAERPDGATVLRALAALDPHGREDPAGGAAAPAEVEAVLGRDDAWAQLRGAWAQARGGSTVVAVVRGAPGIGKTALCRAFLAERRAAGAWVLLGRCHVHEQIPFKAIDEVIDGLGQALLRLDPETRAGLLPAERPALARLFPALAPALALTIDASPADEDKAQVRRAASRALRELLLGLAARVPLVIAIDDLQWGDVDSVQVLTELLRPPRVAGWLLVLAHRAEEAAPGSVLQALHELLTRDEPRAPTVVHVELGGLDEDMSAALAAGLLPAASRGRALALAREAAGNPLWITELAREAGAGGTLEAVVQARVAAHSRESQALLELVAIAGRPLPRSLFDGESALARIGPGELVRLQFDHLVRTQVDHRHDALLPFHDRIGELVLARLGPAQLRARHLQLAEGLLRAGLADSERLAFHFQAAGERERACAASLRAAEQAHAALAFDRAADLYAQALALGTHGEAEARALRIRLAAELVDAGRLLAAGQVSLAAAEGAEPGLRLALRRDAAHAWIRGGHLQEGQVVLAALLADEQLAAPRSGLRLVCAVLLLQAVVHAWLLWRLDRPRVASCTPAQRHRMDLMRRATDLYFTGEWLLAVYWLLRHAHLAFRTADAEHQAIALSRFAYLEGGRWGRRGPAMEARARALSEAQAGAVAVHFQEGLLMTRLMQARFREVEALAVEHRRSFMAQRGLDRFGRDLHEVHRVTALSLRGELRAAQAAGPPLLGRLRERGDRAGMMMFAVSVGYLLHLCADDEAAARAQLDEASAFLAANTARANTRLPRAVVALYVGPTAADERWIAAYYAEARRTGTLRMVLFAGFIGSVYGLALLASFDRAGGRTRLRAAARLGARLVAIPTAFARGYGEALRAGVAERRGQIAAALEAWTASEAGFTAADMQAHALAARRGRGALLGGSEGAALVDACDAALRAQGVARPERFVRIVAPGPAAGRVQMA